jgi:PTH1 family peptidyl-tRNA hydrolase
MLKSLLGRGQRQAEGPPSMVIVGLGNPGGEYAQTRHNVGFWCVDILAKEHSIALGRRHRTALVGEGVIAGSRVALAKPRTYMNLSGEAVRYLLARYRVSPRQLLVIYDDMDLPLGKLRLRPSGSAGGHNGIKSIIQATGSQEFPRIRIGIGRPAEGLVGREHVLGHMSSEERKAAEDAVRRAAEAVAFILTEGIEAAMNRFN